MTAKNERNALKLIAPFDEIVTAFEWGSTANHFFIDLKKNKIENINENIEIEEESGKKLEEMSGNEERFIEIPYREPSEEFDLMQEFAYEKVADKKIAKELSLAIDGKKPFRVFKDVLLNYPETREKWFKFHNENIEKRAILWLKNNGIELSDNRTKIATKFEINELSEEEIVGLPSELKDFGPIACMKCHFEDAMKIRFFRAAPMPECRQEEENLEKEMKTQFNISHFGNWVTGKELILNASKCPNCGSEEIFFDY